MSPFTIDYAEIPLGLLAGAFFFYCVAFDLNWLRTAMVIGAAVLAFILRVGIEHFVLLLPIKTTLIPSNLDIICIYGIFGGCILGAALKLGISCLKSLRRSGQIHGS
jgi:hypothetical protein